MMTKTNTAFTNNRRWKFSRLDPRTLIAYLLVATGYVTSLVAYALNGRTILDADEAAEMVLASHLNQTGRFLSGDWYYSTELRVLNTQIINKLALAVFPGNWHAARTLAIAILTLILVISYLILVYAANLGWIGVITALALVVPFSTQYSYVVLYGSFYVPHIALTFILAALTLQILKMWEQKKAKSRLLFTAAACVISLLAGLGGVRQFLVFHAPLLVTAFLMMLFESYQKGSAREIFTAQSGFLFLTGIAETVFCVLGVGINSAILQDHYTFEEYTKVSLNSISLSSFWDYLDSVFQLWGYEGCAELRDITGAAALCGLMFCALFFILIFFCLHNFEESGMNQRFFVLFFISGVLVNTLFYLLANNPMPRFLMPAAIMILPVIPVALDYKDGFGCIWKKMILTAFIFCLLVQSTNYFWYYAFRDKGRVATAEEQVTDWLLNQGYTSGYATFWNGDNITELSNGLIEMWVIETDMVSSDWSECKINEWLQVKNHMSVKPDGPVFLLLDEEEVMEASEAHGLPFADHIVYENHGYCVYHFESYDEFFPTSPGL